MNKFKIAFICLALFCISSAQADGDDSNNSSDFKYCEVSKVAINDYEPKIFEKNNNLLRKTGEQPIFCGESIIVYGRVLDQNCVPVADAKIYLWQTDCQGLYPYSPLRKNIIDKNLINDTQNETTFTGNGIATTNNNGEFHFITVYPPAIHKYPPHVNVRVEHFSMGSLQTRLILQDHKVTNVRKDPDLSRISKAAYQNGLDIYKFEIIIPGENNKDYE